MTWRPYGRVAVGVGLVMAVISATTAGPAVAQGVKAVQAIIVNATDNPVPVAVVSSAAVAPPLWQGTPLAARGIIINRDSPNQEYCETTATTPPNTVILLHTVSGSMSVAPGDTGLVYFRITQLDGSMTTIVLPMSRTGASLQESVHEQYTGSLQLGGFPVTQIESCAAGVGTVGDVAYIGYTVNVP